MHLGRLRGYEADEASPLLLSAVNYALTAVFCGELTVLIGDMVVGRRRAGKRSSCSCAAAAKASECGTVARDSGIRGGGARGPRSPDQNALVALPIYVTLHWGSTRCLFRTSPDESILAHHLPRTHRRPPLSSLGRPSSLCALLCACCISCIGSKRLLILRRISCTMDSSLDSSYPIIAPMHDILQDALDDVRLLYCEATTMRLCIAACFH